MFYYYIIIRGFPELCVIIGDSFTTSEDLNTMVIKHSDSIVGEFKVSEIQGWYKVTIET